MSNITVASESQSAVKSDDLIADVLHAASDLDFAASQLEWMLDALNNDEVADDILNIVDDMQNTLSGVIHDACNLVSQASEIEIFAANNTGNAG